jgi:alpha-L-rhamnosidase
MNPSRGKPLGERQKIWKDAPQMTIHTRFFWLACRLAALLILPAGWIHGDGLHTTGLRVEYLDQPLGLDVPQPRLSWQLTAVDRAQRQVAYRIRVASTPAKLADDQGDLWDSGRVESDETVNIPYAGKPLGSRQVCHWRVETWDGAGKTSRSEPAFWTMGLLQPEDWQAQWIAYRDTTPVHQNRQALYLPAARNYRTEFRAAKKVQRATVYASALGLFELHVNGHRVGDACFEPGWADYIRRAHYRTHDVTPLVRRGANCLGALVADGWYAGYVGYGLLVGYGPHKTGRGFYGKTPALLAQLEIEYTDGTRDVVITDTHWQVSGDGPIREADLIMGEAFDARRDDPGWCLPGIRAGARATPAWVWQPAIRAEANGPAPAPFFDNCGERAVDLGFKAPPRLEPYAAPPIRITQELKPRRILEPKLGVYIVDLGQNFAGFIRLRVKGKAGRQIQLRHGEMLHPDGRLMTENLRRARATDFYTLRGDPQGETWQPRFTYHGFQYVEISGLESPPALDSVTGLVLHNDTPLTGEFACSDDLLTRFWRNTQWTQRANFIEMPTDCPQRDERLGWMGDAQIYVRTASYNANIAAFFTKWLADVAEAQRESGAYPDYCPYPMGHGAPGQTWGTAWTDAGIICPYTIWQVYGDTRLLARQWPSMTRFMDWRRQRAPDFRGRKDGNTWGDWLNVNEPTPIELIDAAYFHHDAVLMAEMARALSRNDEAVAYDTLAARIAEQFAADYVAPDGSVRVDSQTAHVLAVALAGVEGDRARALVERLAARIAQKGQRMATGFLGTKHLLPTLSAHGQNDLACRLFQSRQYPSWGYEVLNGANTVWERWDSFTKEHGFNGAGGDQNASMNSFSHYSFGAVLEWGFRDLAGIDTDGPGYKRIRICPHPPTPGSNPDQPTIDWVRASYQSLRGPIQSAWRRQGERFELEVSIPANTTGTVWLPAASVDAVSESGKPLAKARAVRALRTGPEGLVLAIESGTYRFVVVPGKAPGR